MVVLIVPCFNETARLQLEPFLAAASNELRFLFVDDGSSDGTYEFIQQRIAGQAHCRALRLAVNQGKGEAVRFAALELQKMDWWQQLQWFGYWDADLATPLSEVPRFLAYSDFYQGVNAVWGSRVYRLGSHIVRSSLRHYLGRGFATLVHLLLQVEAYDTQCGAKIFEKNLLPIAFAEPFLSRWIFDIEILLRLKNQKVIEYPLRTWEDMPGSKVKVLKEILRVFSDILKIKKKYL